MPIPVVIALLASWADPRELLLPPTRDRADSYGSGVIRQRMHRRVQRRSDRGGGAHPVDRDQVLCACRLHAEPVHDVMRSCEAKPVRSAHGLRSPVPEAFTTADDPADASGIEIPTPASQRVACYAPGNEPSAAIRRVDRSKQRPRGKIDRFASSKRRLRDPREHSDT